MYMNNYRKYKNIGLYICNNLFIFIDQPYQNRCKVEEFFGLSVFFTHEIMVKSIFITVYINRYFKNYIFIILQLN